MYLFEHTIDFKRFNGITRAIYSVYYKLCDTRTIQYFIIVYAVPSIEFRKAEGKNKTTIKYNLLPYIQSDSYLCVFDKSNIIF